MRIARLGEAVEIIAGQSPPGDTYNHIGIGMPFFQGKVDFGDLHPTPRVWCTQPERIAEPGDVLVSVRAPVGPSNVADVRCCIGRGLAAVRAGPEIDPDYLAWFIRARVSDLAAQGKGSTFAAISRREIQNLLIPIPSLGVQRTVAARLASRLTVAEQAQGAARESTRSCADLVVQLLLAAASRSKEATVVELSSVVQILPSPSVSSDGDVFVRTVTSGCLTPAGFTMAGVGRSRMTVDAAAVGLINAGEVLVARSNTEALVGRAALYPGGSDALVVSDLIFRLLANPTRLMPEFLAFHLAALQLAGFWRDRSSGASSTMKKITKALLLGLQIPVPPLRTQRQITDELRDRLDRIDRLGAAARAQRAAIEALPDAFLREAFDGRAGMTRQLTGPQAETTR